MNVSKSNQKNNKYILFDILINELKKEGYEIENLTSNIRSNPLAKISKDRQHRFIYVSEASTDATKPTNSDWIFAAMGKWHNEQIEPDKTFWIVIDCKSTNPRYVLVELDKINFHYNKNKYLQFAVKRPKYNGFFNTENRTELLTKIKNEKSKDNNSYNKS